MSEKVSLAIPTYNRSAWLKECIRSILDQTFQDFSLYVFDNASSEPVQEEVKKYEDERIRFVGSERNLGSTGNINRILQYPFESEYVIIFHDDDTMHPNTLEIETSFLDAQEDLVFVVSDLSRAREGTMQRFPAFPVENTPHTIYRKKSDFIRAQMSWLRYAFNSAMYRVGALQNARMRPEMFSDFADMIFLAEISKKGPCAFLKVPLVNYRVHASQDSGLLKQDHAKGAFATLSFFRESLSSSLGKLDKKDEKLFRTYSFNFLLRSYTQINNGLFGLFRFLQQARSQKLIRYQDFLYMDARGAISLLSIVFRNKKIIDTARWVKNLFQS